LPEKEVVCGGNKLGTTTPRKNLRRFKKKKSYRKKIIKTLTGKVGGEGSAPVPREKTGDKIRRQPKKGFQAQKKKFRQKKASRNQSATKAKNSKGRAREEGGTGKKTLRGLETT